MKQAPYNPRRTVNDDPSWPFSKCDTCNKSTMYDCTICGQCAAEVNRKEKGTQTYRVYGHIRVEVEIIVNASTPGIAKDQAKKFGSESWSCDIDEQIHPPVTLYVEDV